MPLFILPVHFRFTPFYFFFASLTVFIAVFSEPPLPKYGFIQLSLVTVTQNTYTVVARVLHHDAQRHRHHHARPHSASHNE